MNDDERALDARSNEIRTSCMNSIDLIEFFTDVMGVPLERLTDGLRAGEEFLRNSANWIDNYDTYRLYHNCHHAVADFSHKDWYRVGQASHTNNAAGYFKILLKLLSTDVIYRRIPSFISHTSKVSEYRLLETEPGHVRLRYAIPDRKIALGYTIGSECWYHLGILSTLPKLQDEGSPVAATNHEICSMPVGHILQNSYDLSTADFEYTDEGVVVFGTLLGRWVRLEAIDGSPDTFSREHAAASRSEANAILILRELDIGATRAFVPGEIYDAPHCLFDVRYENRSFLRRLASYLRLGARYHEEQMRKTEELYLDLHKLRYEEERLEQTLHSVVGGPILVPPLLSPDGEGAALTEPAQLTRREREIAEQVALGMTNGDIAEDLFISRETVKRHLANIYAKLGVKNRVQLARKLAGTIDQT